MSEDAGAAPVEELASHPSKRRRGRVWGWGLVGGVAAVAVALVLVLRPGHTTRTPADAAHEAGRNLRKAVGASLRGTYAGGEATFDVTRAGTARGIYTFKNLPVGRTDVGGVTYIKGGRGFWKAHHLMALYVGTADGAWTRAPDGTAPLNLASLSPDQLGRNLEDVPADQAIRRTTLNGVKALTLTTVGLTYYLTADTPSRVLRITGKASDGAYSFDVAPIAGSNANAFFATIRNDVQALRDAFDPYGSEYTSDWKPHWGACGVSGCTVSGTAQPYSSAGLGTPLHVITTLEFRGRTGGTVTKCSDSTRTKLGSKIHYSCRAEGPAWESWYVSHNGRFQVRVRMTYIVRLNTAAEITTLLNGLTREAQPA